jgi:hypothetical protein
MSPKLVPLKLRLEDSALKKPARPVQFASV